MADKEDFIKERLEEIAKLKVKIKELEELVKHLQEVRSKL